jgi:fatty acid desaturase
MRSTPTLLDARAVPAYAPTRFQLWLEGMLYDPRDAVLVRLMLKMVAFVLPLQVLLYVYFTPWLGAAYLALVVGWLSPPVILALHNTMHRPLFKRRPFLNRAHPYAMTALFGIPAGYAEHHVGMHHVENNLAGDLSSTMTYERDNVGHFLLYFGRFMAFSLFNTPAYLFSKKRTRLAWRAVVSETAHVALMVGLSFVNWRATLVAFVLPYLLVRLAQMIGNWGQHAFIDPRQPGSSYLNSITCINSGYNKRCFNDGYHIGHHVKQNRHWTELPADFDANRERYAREGSVVFEKLDFFVVSLLLFARRYDVLAKCYVNLSDKEMTQDEIIAHLKSRTRPIAVAADQAVAFAG